MSNKLFFMFSLILGSLCWGQSQSGSEAIAEAIAPSTETSTADFTNCVKDLVGTNVVANEAIRACTEIAKIASHTVTRVANEAADATKASRPIIFMSRYGNRGWGSGGQVLNATVRTERTVALQQARTERSVALLKARTERTVALQQARAERTEAARKARAERAEKK